MGRLFRIFRRKKYSVSYDKIQGSVIYRERGRSVQIRGEAMPDGYAVFASSIRHWDATAKEAINEMERQRITANIHSYFVDRGKNIYIS